MRHKVATERLLSSTLVLDQMAGSSWDDLRSCAEVEASLGLSIYERENLEGPKFVKSVISKLSRVKNVVEALLDEVATAEEVRLFLGLSTMPPLD